MEINYDELKKQRAEAIRKTNEYCEYQCIFQSGDENPLTTLSVVNVGDEEVAKLIKLMEINLKYLKDKFKIASMLSKHMEVNLKESHVDKHKNDK